MTNAVPPGDEALRHAPADDAPSEAAGDDAVSALPGDARLGKAPGADSAGRGWTGRALTSTGFDGDLGEPDTGLLAALDNPRDESALMRALGQARLLVPVVAMPGDVKNSGEAKVESSMPAVSTAGSSTDMAVVTLTASDGRRAFPVFSSMATLSAWDARARPSPVTSSRAAQGAVSERCDVMLLDCGSGHELVIRPSMVWALAQQREWLPAHTDAFVVQALIRATADEQDVIDCVGEGDPSAPAILRVVLRLRPGLSASRVQALATRIGERIATDGEARARIDGLSFTIRQA